MLDNDFYTVSQNNLPDIGVGTLVIEDRNSYDRNFHNVIIETVFFRNGFLSFETQGTDKITNVASATRLSFISTTRFRSIWILSVLCGKIHHISAFGINSLFLRREVVPATFPNRNHGVTLSDADVVL